MNVQPFDEYQHHGHTCHVEEVWDDEAGHHWAMMRPVDECCGCYIVDTTDEQDDDLTKA